MLDGKTIVGEDGEQYRLTPKGVIYMCCIKKHGAEGSKLANEIYGHLRRHAYLNCEEGLWPAVVFDEGDAFWSGVCEREELDQGVE